MKLLSQLLSLLPAFTAAACAAGETPQPLLTPEEIVRKTLDRPSPADWKPTKLDRSYYCDLIERIVRNAAPWVDERGAVIDPVIHKEWGQTTCRFVSSGAIALHFGRCSDLQETIFRAMDYATNELAFSPEIKHRSPDFWMRELAVAWKLLAPLAPAERHEKWRQNLAAVEPQKNYYRTADTEEERKKLHNWCIYASAGESLRESFGIGGKEGTLWGNAFFDAYMEHQFQYFNPFGMYRDPNDPFTYDITTRLQIAAALHGGYRGKFAKQLDDLNRKADFVLLLMLSPKGEVPFGGRSSQFHFQEAIVAALCEQEAVRYKESDPQLAGAFKRQAHLSANIVRDSILREDGKLFHIKNRFAPETRHGCDPYGHYSVYSLFAGSVFGLAALYADDSIAEAPCPAELGGYGFSIEGSFEKGFANVNGNYLEFDLLGNPMEDATGLGRVFLPGIPRGILPAAPFAADPHFVIDEKLSAPNIAASIAPEWLDAEGKRQCLAEKSLLANDALGHFRTVDAEKGLFEAEYLHKGVKVLYRSDISTKGELRLTLTLEGDIRSPYLVFPLLEFDGEKQIDPLEFVEFTMTPQKGGVAANRNGLYRLYRFPFSGKHLSFAVRAKTKITLDEVKAATEELLKSDSSRDSLRGSDAQNTIQRACNAVTPQEYKAFYERGITIPEEELQTLYRKHPVFYCYDRCFDKVLNELKTEEPPPGGVLLWHIYNLGFVVKTEHHTFGIDIHHRRAEELVPYLDFVLVTHNHSDHMTNKFLSAVNAAGKNVYSGFWDSRQGGYSKEPEREFTFGDLTICSYESDHAKNLKKFVTPFEIRCGKDAKSCVIFASGDSYSAKQLHPKSRRVDFHIVHPYVGLDVAESAAKTVRPQVTLIGHLQEMHHARNRFRWSFQDGYKAAEKVRAVKCRAQVPMWGEKIVWTGVAGSREER